eukprot:762158-Hanusia_phi.AAC.7
MRNPGNKRMDRMKPRGGAFAFQTGIFIVTSLRRENEQCFSLLAHSTCCWCPWETNCNGAQQLQISMCRVEPLNFLGRTNQ